jgi:predicted RNA-binding protein Jag
MSFLKKFFGQEVKNAMNDFTSFLVTFDPETASDAQMEVFKEKFNELSLKVATARSNFDKECKEYLDAKKSYDQRVVAAEILQKKLAGTEPGITPESDPKTLEGLNALLDKLEELKPEVEREKQESEEAEEIFNELTGYLKEFTAKMEGAQKAIVRAKADMARASIEKERAQLRNEAAMIKSGLSKDKNDLNVVLNAFTQKAEKDRTEASAANLRVEALKKPDIEKDNDAVAAALREAAGESEKPKDAASRLAALKG